MNRTQRLSPASWFILGMAVAGAAFLAYQVLDGVNAVEVSVGASALVALLAAFLYTLQRRAPAAQAEGAPGAELRHVVQAIGGAAFSLDAGRTITSWSDGAAQLLGFPAEVVIGNPVAFLIPDDLQDDIVATLDRAASGTPTPELETRILCSDGEAIPVSLSLFALPAPGDEGAGYGIVVGDVRAVVEVREALSSAVQRERADEELLHAIIDNSTAAIYVKDIEGRYLLVNREWERLTGVSRASAIGLADHDVFPAEIAERFRLHDLAVIASRVPQDFEERGASTDGEDRVYLSTRIPLFGQDDDVQRICGFSTDITERKRSQDTMISAHEAAEAASRAKTEFLSRMSHELRTPLNVVLGFGQVLELDPLTPDQRESVDHILKAGRHLLNLIDEVLDLSRIEANRMQLSIEPLVVGEMLREILGLTRPLAAEREITVELRDEHCDLHVSADRQRIKQVMLNLLSNAIKYNRERGHITISCSLSPNGNVRLSVADTGIGIHPDRMDRLFGAFDRLGAEASGFEGTGLGLALSHRLVHAMGGDIGAESMLGEGTTFWVDLPLAQPPAAEPATADAAGASGEPGQRSRVVLYIEDNLANLHLIERLLKQRPGMQLLAAMQGSLGLELAREQRPDLIVLDLHLPDMQGDRVLAELQGDARTRDIPVIVASADATPGSVERLLAAGAHAYLTKPFALADFLRVIDEAIGS